MCPISFAQAVELQNPVGFNSKHAFDCDMLVNWLTRHHPTNPITAADVQGKISDILTPLIVNGNDMHVTLTQSKLDKAGYALDQLHVYSHDMVFDKLGLIAQAILLVVMLMGFIFVPHPPGASI